MSNMEATNAEEVAWYYDANHLNIIVIGITRIFARRAFVWATFGNVRPSVP